MSSSDFIEVDEPVIAADNSNYSIFHIHDIKTILKIIYFSILYISSLPMFICLPVHVYMFAKNYYKINELLI